ncbi:MHYT domain-containing protein [Paenibacillus radicis (ex Xue et al. 2023)]|uniref:histidine kinase n=1 Tax=Paenibacillus radicis (ex Xue et al. 2023) TaxID=2972489 RepID=A0ABT1YEP8_9BACL|nr:MHYT domain-containing protein [Paenibacillus radicis (ex Xue et al. 2023)]MCR8631392.1 PAS domain S-box protein [Paenibacillus radicis (ex Xue et al. 2023)]
MGVNEGNFYSVPLVVLSIVIAIFSSYVSLDLSHKARSSSNRKTRNLFLIYSSFSLGIGIWTMHFVGMLAFHTHFPVSYNLLLTGISFVIPILTSFIAFRLASRLKTYRFIFACFCMGMGISSMHYIGMAALESSYSIKYDPLLFAVSVFIPIGVSFISMFRMFQDFLDGWGKLANALLLGIGISGMHYTGMSAMHFTVGTSHSPPGNSLFAQLMSYVMETTSLSYVVCSALFLLVGCVCFGAHLDRRLAYEAASKNELHFQSLFEHSPDIVCSIDLQGKIVSANGATEKLLGYSKDELKERMSTEFIVPEESEKFEQLFENVKHGMPQNYEIHSIHKQGFIMEFSVTTIPIIFRKKVIGVFAIAKDITERKRNEERLRRAEKFAMAGQLAAGIAHEIRNPLTTVRGMTQLIREGISKQSYFDLMLSEMGQIESILSEFLLLANPGEFKTSNLHEILTNIVMQMDARALLSNIHILVEYETDTPWIFCDENKIRHVFNHVLANAIESMNDGGDINVQICFVDDDKVQIRFTDQGVGIPDEWQNKLGEPYYSTKDKGTGIGLMISYQIIHEHNGEIHIYKAGRRGTVVDITLPVTAEG